MKGPLPTVVSLALAACLLLWGCGRKAPPVPPGTLIPRRVEGLKARVTVNGVVLSWKVPVRHTDGSPMGYLKGFELFRAQLPPGRACPGCPVRFGRPLFIPYHGRLERERRVVYEDRTVTPRYRYVYAVRAVKGLFNKGPLSRRLEVVWHIPPASPRGLKAVWKEGAVVLSWSPVQTLEDGSPANLPVAYLVQRRRAGAREWRKVAQVKAPPYRDASVEPGIVYTYRIVPFITHLSARIEGPPSGPVRPTALDITPPAPPKGLVASVTPRGVELRWRASPEPDLAGYYVYRRERRGPMIRLNHRPLTEPLFLDRTLLPPGIYSYTVTAVDRSVPPNESRPAPWASVRIEARPRARRRAAHGR